MKQIGYMLQAIAIRLGLAIARLMPLSARTRFVGGVTRLLVAWVPILRRRITDNLDQVRPDLNNRVFVGDVGYNVGRTLTEILFNAEFATVAAQTPITGPGLAALHRARAEGKGAIIVSGHFGQWEAIRHALRAQGLEVGAMYRPNNNPYYEPLFRAGIEHGGAPIIAKGPAGNRLMLRHLRGGGQIALLCDQYQSGGALLSLLGQPAVTTLSPAELALRYDLPLVPAFAPRGADGIEITIETPIPHGDPAQMMQDFNDRLGVWISAHPAQWYWLHQRWKVFPWDLPQDA